MKKTMLIAQSVGGSELLQESGCGLLELDAQSAYERAFSPLPSPSGQLVHDPDFELPSLAGAIPWRLYYYSCATDVQGPFGRGRRASWPLHLAVERNLANQAIVTVTLEREDGLGASYVSQNSGATFTSVTPRIFDTLEPLVGGGFIEKRSDTGTIFYYPDGDYVALSRYETVQQQTVTFHYDSEERLERIEAPAGQEIYYEFDTIGNRVKKVSDNLGRIHTLTYAGGALYTIEDPGGYTTTFGYDPDFHLTKIVDPNGFTTTYSYDSQGKVLSRAIGGNVASYAYQNGGTRVVYTDPYGKTWTTDLDGNGNVISVTDPLNATRQANYSSKGLPERIIDANGHVTTIAYNSLGKETSHQEPNENPVVRNYDSYGNLVSEVDPFGSRTTYNYDPVPHKRQVSWMQDALGRYTTYTYYGWGGLESVQDYFGFRTTYTHDDYGQLVTETNPLGFVRTYGYDRAGNLVSEVDEEGRIITHQYTPLGILRETANAIGAIRTYIHDGVGNLKTQIDPIGNRTSFGYDALQNEIWEKDALGNITTTTYDAKGREIKRLDPNGNSITYIYDFADRRVVQLDAKLRPTTTNYDPARRVVSVQDTSGLLHTTIYDQPYGESGIIIGYTTAQLAPGGYRTTSVYDLGGRLIRSIDTSGNVTKTQYDALGRVQAIVEPTGARTTTLYDIPVADVSGNPMLPEPGYASVVINALGHRSTSLYDAADNLRVSIDPSGRRYTTLYDKSGLRAAEYAPDGTWVTRIYDPAGRNTANVNHLGLRTTTEYDLADRVKAFIDEDNKRVEDDYDAAGRVKQSQDRFGNLHKMEYDKGGRFKKSEFYKNGTTTPENSVNIDYDIDNSVVQYDAGQGQLENYFYDPFGRFQGTANAFGDRNTYKYDLHGRLWSEIDPEGVTVTLVYDSASRWAAEEYAGGYRFSVNFDEYGREIGYTDESGSITTYTLDLLNRPYQIKDALGNVSAMEYDVLGRITRQTDPLGRTATTQYDPRGNVKTQQDALGNVTTYHYDGFGRIEAVENALRYRTTTHYDALGRVDWVQNARGNKTFTHYDAFGRVVATEDTLGKRTTTHYDWAGRVEAIENQLGYLATTEYDALGRVKATVDAEGARTESVYDNAGRVIATVDPYGKRTTTEYDRAGRVKATEDALNNRTLYSYNARGLQQSVKNARNYITTYEYDARGYQIAVIDPLLNRTTTEYDALGRVKASIDALGNRTTNYYDAAGQLEAVENARGYRTSYFYDALGRPTVVWDALGRRTTTVYDPLGRVVEVQNPKGYSTTFNYDPVGNRTAVANGLGYRTSYYYDVLDRLEAKEDPLGRRHTMHYDAAGRMDWTKDAKGQVTTHEYNKRGEETLRVYVDGLRVTTGYDALGRIVTVMDAHGTTTNIYDELSRLRATNGPGHPNNQAITYSYDEVGNRKTMSGWWGTFTYGYDARNLLSELQDPGNAALGQAARTITWAYDPRGLRSGQTHGDGSRTTFGYDALGQKTFVRHVDSAGTELERAFYDYDEVGRPKFYDTKGVRHTYGYDALDQLTSEWAGTTRLTWEYDRAGRRIRENKIAPTSSSSTNVNLTGAVLHKSDNNSVMWNTRGGDGRWNLYLSTDSTPSSFINSGNTSSASINISLVEGNNTFYYFAESSSSGSFVLSLVLNGTDSSVPDISVVVPVGSSSFSAFNGTTKTLNETAVTSLNTVTSTKNGYTITLTSYNLANSPAKNVVSPFNNTSGSGNDYYGSFTLNVTANPTTTVTTYVYDVADQLQNLIVNGVTNATYTYDANGSVISRALGTSGVLGLAGTTTLTWDGANRLYRLTPPGGKTTAQLYRHDGLRFAQVRLDPTVPGTNTATDGLQTVRELALWEGSTPTAWRWRPGTYLKRLSDDTSTKGTWKPSVYGTQGYYIANGSTGIQLTTNSASWSFTGASTHLWAGTAADGPDPVPPQTPFTDVKALQKPSAATDRVAGKVFSTTSFTVSVTVPYDEQRRVAFYALDWDGSNGRAMSVTVRDTVTGNTLDTVSVSSFGAGKWLRWTVSGPVEFVFTKTAGADACLSGLFIDPAPSGSALYPTYLSETFVQEPSGSGLVRSRGADRANAALDRSALLDGLGSVQGTLVAGSGGGASTMTGLAARDAFGNPLSGSGSSATGDQPFQYLGGLGYWEEPELGLTYVRARWLDTATATWLSVDSVDGEPRYSYAHNSPTIGADPTGTDFLGFRSIGEFVETLRYVPAAARKVYVDPAARAWEATKQASKKFQTKIEQAYSSSVGVIRNIYSKLEDFFHQANASYEAGRKQLPPLLHNLLPPLPTNITGFAKYQLGLIWGAIQGLFGMVPIVGAIPDIVDFLKFFFDHVAKEGFLKAIGSYLVEQWSGMKALFTQKLNMDPFQRGEIVGNILVSLIVTVVGIILTGGAALPVLLEGGMQNIFKNAKRMAKAGITAAKTGAKVKITGIAEAAKHIENINKLGIKGHVLKTRARIVTFLNLKRKFKIGEVKKYAKAILGRPLSREEVTELKTILKNIRVTLREKHKVTMKNKHTGETKTMIHENAYVHGPGPRTVYLENRMNAEQAGLVYEEVQHAIDADNGIRPTPYDYLTSEDRLLMTDAFAISQGRESNASGMLQGYTMTDALTLYADIQHAGNLRLHADVFDRIADNPMFKYLTTDEREKWKIGAQQMRVEAMISHE